MNLEQLKIDFAVFGIVDFLGYNGDNENMLIIAISGFTTTMSKINDFNAMVTSKILPTFSKIDEFNVSVNMLKAVYSKA